jgi:hypothetical protein
MTDHLTDYTDDERRLFQGLSKDCVLDPHLEDAVVARLRREGLLRTPVRRFASAAFLALAAGLIAVAWLGGVRYGAQQAHASSIEGLLARADLSDGERTLLMQRAGSAYVAAAHAYASSVKSADSTAVEVSSQVLMGAAQAVARTNLNGALATRIAGLMKDAQAGPVKTQPVIWY